MLFWNFILANSFLMKFFFTFQFSEDYYRRLLKTTNTKNRSFETKRREESDRKYSKVENKNRWQRQRVWPIGFQQPHCRCHLFSPPLHSYFFHPYYPYFKVSSQTYMFKSHNIFFSQCSTKLIFTNLIKI
jgi:hypothetical protein